MQQIYEIQVIKFENNDSNNDSNNDNNNNFIHFLQ